MKPGILNSVLVEQVRNTAAWLWADPSSSALTAIFDAARDEPLDAPGALERTLRLRLAAHYATVATFVPTDVDAHIRHHMWLSVGDAETFARAKACIDEAVARDARLVSARVTRGLSGHDGEWLSVRAGALGRALVLGLAEAAEVLAAEIDAELERERRAFAEALEQGAPATVVLALATTIAHNLGDLSRVVDAWPKVARASEHCARYSRLGHSDGARAGAEFLVAGALNKELMALENHRFLALRKPRALRRSRALLLPVGPWFDAWGETVCRSELLDDADRAEVVAALVELHLRSPAQEGCLRALAAFHRSTRGGLAWYDTALPARLRKEIGRGRIREALDVSRERFEARIEGRCRTLIARLTDGASQRLRASA
ncbi:MAG TPA: hypothetical protein VFL84_14060 [Gammaproteobacteria bacterium]|nr:hypothetical protein [Gammaproteobacteria bacterium]